MSRHFLKIVFAFSGLVASAAMVASASAQAPLLEASLVQSFGDSNVYFIQDGRKRLVVSEEAFNAQGFRWSDISIVEPVRLGAYAPGEDILPTPFLGLTPDRSLLPDLAPVAPYDLRFSVEDGRTRLRFTATFWNRGKGAMELRANALVASGDGAFDASQRLFRPDGSSVDRPVGTFFWHEVHEHYHYDDFGKYTLELLRPASGSPSIAPILTQKTTFCLRDDQTIGAPSDGPKQPQRYAGCRGHVQGVSVGWADVYRYTLTDQYVDVTGLPAGVYKLSFSVDPNSSFFESRRDNNVSATLVRLDPARRTLAVIGTASPYETTNNTFPDGTLIQADGGDAKVYVIRANKKRWIRTEQAFLSYGYAWGNINQLPAGAVAAIPHDKLVRVDGTARVYILNEGGYLRHILNPEVMTSYGWTGADIAVINQTEFDTYAQTDLIRLAGDPRVFSITKKRYVAMVDDLQSLGLPLESVHVVNATDFRALLETSVAARDLMIPWDIGFLPDGDMLVTERTGTLRRIGRQNGVMTVADVLKGGEGGLMGIAVDARFDENHFIYLYYTTDSGGKKNRITRFRLEGTQLISDKIILDGIPSAIYHDGGQIDFGPDGKLYVATGDATQPDLAQDKNSLAGKILRINSDGTIPSDNPFGNAVWSYGHRNPQGFAWDKNGNMFASEHGPSGEFGLCCRDEVNRIVRGWNYGWPVISGYQTREGMMTPVVTSGESATWAPSGLTIAGNKLFFSGLRGSALFYATIDDQGGLRDLRSTLSGTYGRLRAAVMGPDGLLYLTTSNRDGRGTVRTGDDKVLKVSPDYLTR